MLMCSIVVQLWSHFPKQLFSALSLALDQELVGVNQSTPGVISFQVSHFSHGGCVVVVGTGGALAGMDTTHHTSTTIQEPQRLELL